jgi:hypothetical protein
MNELISMTMNHGIDKISGKEPYHPLSIVLCCHCRGHDLKPDYRMFSLERKTNRSYKN